MTEKDYNMAEQEKLKPKQKPHYVDNKKFLGSNDRVSCIKN